MVNFVGRLSSVQHLKSNLHLTELFLVGNPCTQFQGYREYVVATLPQLMVSPGQKVPLQALLINRSSCRRCVWLFIISGWMEQRSAAQRGSEPVSRWRS